MMDKWMGGDRKNTSQHENVSSTDAHWTQDIEKYNSFMQFQENKE